MDQEKKRIINLFTNKDQRSLSICYEVKNKLEEQGFVVCYDYTPEACLNICIGGDGAFLRAVHKSNFSNIPFVGVNTGHLGFYQEILTPKIDKFINDYTNGSYHIESLDLLNAEIHADKKILRFKALNEFVIKAPHSSIIHLNVFIDNNHLQTFAGDALLVSTPAGSTAYNFSAGGSILYQSLDGYQMTPLAPINSKAYRSLYNSIVIPSQSILRMEKTQDDQKTVLLLTDGVESSYDSFEYVNFTIDDQRINKLVFDRNWYWNNVKDKFL